MSDLGKISDKMLCWSKAAPMDFGKFKVLIIVVGECRVICICFWFQLYTFFAIFTDIETCYLYTKSVISFPLKKMMYVCVFL